MLFRQFNVEERKQQTATQASREDPDGHQQNNFTAAFFSSCKDLTSFFQIFAVQFNNKH